MFKNYLKIAFRNLVKYKGYSFINVLGLAIGMACCILILLYVQDELSFDKHHENSDRIFRLSRQWFNSDGSSSLHLGHVAPPIAPLLKNDFSEIMHVARMTDGGTPLIKYGDKFFEENRFFFADPNILEIFTLPLFKGDPQTALQNPNNVLLAEATAQKYFGDEDPIDKTITFLYRGVIEVDLKVTGVLAEIPRNSHFHFDFLGSMKALELAFGDDEFQSWGSNNYSTFVLLPEGYEYKNLEAKFPDFLDRHLGAATQARTGQPPARQPSERNKLHLWPLTDIHLHSQLDSEIEANGNIVYVYIFSSVALFILLIACINFMNLATARSASRMTEVGLRKVVGADRSKLIKQFLGESIFLALVSLVIAVFAVELALPWFNNFVGRELSLDLSRNFQNLVLLASIALGVGIAAGSYPAFFLSAFQPASVLKGTKIFGLGGHSPLRRALVIFQFAISIILIISMGVVYNQLEYCNNKELGLTKERILVLPAGSPMIQRYATFKNRLLLHKGVVGVAASKRVPSGRLLDSSGARILDGENSERLNFRIANVQVDHDFLDTYGIELAAGRNFSVDFPTDSTEAFILNETAVKKIGWESADVAVGRAFGYGGRQGKIVGVVKDFHYESLHQPITPIVLIIRAQSLNQISVRVQAEDMAATLGFLEGIWQEYRPNFPFVYDFLDDRYAQLYQNEHTLGQIFIIFSALAVFVACLGLFGLASYTAEQRTKEIGVRKVLGASTSSVIMLLSMDFTKLVIFATIAAWPISYFVMDRWLADFAYRISINSQFDTFIFSAILAFAIAMITVIYQAVKAALSNPINALRYE
jgi:putative ABC transport system permease protein